MTAAAQKIQQMLDDHKSRSELMCGEDAEVIDLLTRALTLSPIAQSQFLKTYDYEWGINGEQYLGGAAAAQRLYPELVAEAATVGVKLVYR